MRPTADRVREALFARLGDLRGAAVLDLYAGSGVLGFEALSRGAASLVCVERAPRSLEALRANVSLLGLGAQVSILAGDASRVVWRLGRQGARFDLALLDPPYASGEAVRALEALRDARILPPGATLVIERSRRHPLPVVEGFALLDERRYGDTVISRLTVAPASAEGPARGGPVRSPAGSARSGREAGGSGRA